ncbi:MoxR family ATPase [Streptomyces luteolifulvus]|jgi:MoxR-like ATPase|uniref:MoxR family ATPase n=1 Tax=Streptomyces luteolifulvus TaxID=2615112 RepID=A0A6H9UUQ0_9ACTN|nr:MoxR family ATPase [Streptomyces luteolifulvus]KAB1143649.1 MoxR family ATPase [Streptomyces luteolifulvus]
MTQFPPQPSPGDGGRIAEGFHSLLKNVEQVISGKTHAVRLALTTLLAEGHLLLEDVPGVGKTSLARAIAASIGGECRRIQFTPDLLPSDITGVSFPPGLDAARRGDFRFLPGPVFANVVLCDEVNRASPKTQSALLEVMEERQVTVAGTSHPVPPPFLVVATQNPVDFDGTYPLPEAQLDRFLMRVRLGYPSEEAEFGLLRSEGRGLTPEALSPVMNVDEIGRLAHAATRIVVSDPVHRYIVSLVTATRTADPRIRLGASPRASLALLRAARVWAAADHRHFVVPEDIRELAGPVLAHRLLLTSEADFARSDAENLITELLGRLKVPR